MSYFPIALPFLFILAVLFIFLFVLIEIGILEYAYERIGLDRRHAFLLLLLSLLGSYVNIPVYQLPPEQVHSGEVVVFFGMHYMIPMVREWPGTVIAVNIGGAVVPTLLSLYLIFKNKLFVRGFFAVCIVTIIVHWLAHPVRGLGIAEPIFIPPLVATAVALLLARPNAPALAYIAGSLGTLIGADLLNLGKIQGLGAPVASIGGAGTFDGIFLTGILAVLIASIMTRARQSA
ncbi:MAG: DUF1614 domain-containing protein [Desulfoferrobacter sp.]